VAGKRQKVAHAEDKNKIESFELAKYNKALSL
jgi:hypothetical protein